MSFKYFAIIGVMRSGSNLLERSLGHHKDLCCFGEAFNPSFIGSPEPDKALSFSLDQREKDPLSLIDWMIDTSSDRIAGFRIFPDHTPMILSHILRDTKCAKIILTRSPLDCFISLKLAQKTDQWRMGDIDTKIEAKIVFDWNEYEEYLEQHQQFYRRVRQNLLSAGEPALLVDYEDLQSIDVINGIAKYIGSAQDMKSFKFRSSKQNSLALADRVENYEEMLSTLKENTRFETAQFEFNEPAITTQSKAVALGQNIDLAYLPTRNVQQDPIIDWMQKLDPKNGAPVTGLGRTKLQNWFKSTQLKFTFTDLEHPVVRAYRTYCDLFMFQNKKYKGIRSLLVKRYGADLVAKECAEEINAQSLAELGYDIKKQRANFKAFLKFLKACLRDQALYQPKPEFSSQSAWLNAHQEWGTPHFVALPHNRDMVLKTIAASMGLSSPSIETENSDRFIFPLDEVYDLQIEKMTRAAYARDYQRFGFLDYLISPK